MGQIIVSEHISLDAVIEAPERWHFPYETEEMGEYTKNQLLSNEALLVGRTTYEAFASFWPNMKGSGNPIAEKLNSAPKYVYSSTLKNPSWENSQVISGNLVESIGKLKQRINGSIGVTGSAMLVQAMLQANLIDELRLMLHPIVLGSGKQLFVAGMESKLKLCDSHTFSSGVILLSYQRA